MKLISLSLIVLPVLIAFSSNAYSQGYCNPGSSSGYWMSDNYCPPASGYRYEKRGYVDNCIPRYSQNFNRYSRDYDAHRFTPDYSYRPGFRPHQSSSSATTYPSYGHPRASSEIEQRLSFVESVLVFLLEKLGLMDEFDESQNSNPGFSQPRPFSGPSSAGGT